MSEDNDLTENIDPRGIKNPDDVHGYCMECGSQQPDKYMMESPFGVPSCKYCGGVTYIGYAERRDRDKAKLDSQRNIGHDTSIKHSD